MLLSTSGVTPGGEIRGIAPWLLRLLIPLLAIGIGEGRAADVESRGR